MEHYVLQNLALEAYGYYVSDILSILIKFSKLEKFDLEYLQPTCKFLKKQIKKKNVHNYLADNIMEIVLKIMLMKNSFLSREHHDEHDYRISIAVQLAIAAIPSSVTSFRYYKFTYPGPVHRKATTFLELYLTELFKKPCDLTALDLGGRLNPKIVQPLLYLQQWTNRNDSDEELEVLATYSKKLWMLDVKYSQSKLGQNFVELVLEFRNLIHLDIGWTPLAKEVKENLIRGFKLNNDESRSNGSRVYLRYLGLDLTSNIVKLIPECLPKLTTLDITLTENTDLIPLNQLNNLTRLSIDTRNPNIQFISVANFIMQIGSRLLTLKIYLDDVDFDFISRHCTKLETFGHYISDNDLLFRQIIDRFSRLSVPKFQSVKSLNLHMSGYDVWRALPFYTQCFMNLKRLCLFKTRRCIDEEDMNQSHFLEECILQPLIQGRYEECTFNGNTLKLCGERVVITNDKGYSITAGLEELKQVLMKIEHVGLLNLKRNIRILTG